MLLQEKVQFNLFSDVTYTYQTQLWFVKMSIMYSIFNSILTAIHSHWLTQNASKNAKKSITNRINPNNKDNISTKACRPWPSAATDVAFCKRPLLNLYRSGCKINSILQCVRFFTTDNRGSC